MEKDIEKYNNGKNMESHSHTMRFITEIHMFTKTMPLFIEINVEMYTLYAPRNV